MVPQTRDHLDKDCPERKPPGEELVGSSIEGDREGKKPVEDPGVRDLLADGRCSQAVLDE